MLDFFFNNHFWIWVFNFLFPKFSTKNKECIGKLTVLFFSALFHRHYFRCWLNWLNKFLELALIITDPFDNFLIFLQDRCFEFYYKWFYCMEWTKYIFYALKHRLELWFALLIKSLWSYDFEGFHLQGVKFLSCIRLSAQINCEIYKVQVQIFE